MKVETEIKVVLEDAEEFQRRLISLNPMHVSSLHFEDNYLLDYADGRIRSQSGALRVRLTEEADFLTFKGAPRPSTVFKSREELETTVEDGRVVLGILERLGLRAWFQYQKYRQEYALASTLTPKDKVLIAVDLTPIGNFAEFEGSEECIRGIAAAMGFTEPQFLRDSYYSLYSRFCRDRGEPVTHMVFPPGQVGIPGQDKEDS